MMIQVSGFGEVGSTIAETVGAAKVYRGHLEDRLREKPAVHQKQNLPSGERRVFLTALALADDYRASLTMFLSSPLAANQVARERRRAEEAGLSYTVKNVVTREDIEDASPPALTINMEGVGNHQDEHLDLIGLAQMVGAGHHLCFLRWTGTGRRRGFSR